MIASSGGKSSRHSRCKTGMSSFGPSGSTRQAGHGLPSIRPATVSPSATVRTIRVTRALPTGSSIGTSPPAAIRDPRGSRTPSSSSPCSRRPAGRLSDRLVRPWLSMSNSDSYSVSPEAWHHAVVISRHAHALASLLPGTSSAAAIPLGSAAVTGVKENSATVIPTGSTTADSGGTSVSRWLTTCGGVRPTFRTIQWPTVDVAPSTQASSTGVARTNGIVRAARIVTGPRAGGLSSTSQRSMPFTPAPPEAPPRRSKASSRRAVTTPTAGGSSDHSSGSSTGSENCTTIESRSDAAG